MAISLTADGIGLDYRTDIQTSVSGTYPVGTVIGIHPSYKLTLPGTWLFLTKKSGGGSWSDSRAYYGAARSKALFGIRVE